MQIHLIALACAKRYLIAEADLLAAIMDVDKHRIYEKFSYAHLTPYCVHELRLSEDVAGNFVRVARKSKLVPELKSALDSGILTISKAKAITAVINPENQELWIERAGCMSRDQLEKAVAAESPKPSKPEKAKPLSATRVRVEFELTAEEMELFRRAQDILSQKKGRAANLSETHVEMLKTFLDRHDPILKAARAPDRISHPPRGGSRRIPASIKHAVFRRDKGRCQALTPRGLKCGQTRWIHLHHIKSLFTGGLNTPENLTTLCSTHHRLLHNSDKLILNHDAQRMADCP